VFCSRLDYFGNPASFFTVQEPHRQLTITAVHVIEVIPPAVPDPTATPPWETVRDLLARDRGPAAVEACQFVFDSPYVHASPELTAYAAVSFDPGRPLLQAVLDLTGRIHTEFRYDPRATTLATPLQEVFANRRGVCQDFAHLQIACLRSQGLAARYISGYLCTMAPPGRERLVGADASHAWLSVYCPGHGWIDIDPTNNVIPSDKHVLLAWGRDYDDVSPIKGVILGGGQHTVKVAVDVVPLEEVDGDASS
jgi:transglutaminase-like putative cysteine protease